MSLQKIDFTKNIIEQLLKMYKTSSCKRVLHRINGQNVSTISEMPYMDDTILSCNEALNRYFLNDAQVLWR